jgi:hypothetical protein
MPTQPAKDFQAKFFSRHPLAESVIASGQNIGTSRKLQ